MANICEYRVKVKGRKNACYAFYGSMSCMDYKEVDNESGSGNSFTLMFSGNCKWSVDSYCKEWDGECPVNLPADPEAAYNEAEEKYWYKTVQDRSKMFDLEVWCNSCDIDGDPDIAIYEHYKNGEPIVDELPEELEIEGTSEIRNVAEATAMNDKIADQLGELEALLGKLEKEAEAAGIDLYPSNIGETGYDMYKWSFTEGKRKSGKGWSIAIPDGFSVIDSKDNRAFEAVPQGMESEDTDPVPVRILPGMEQAIPALTGEFWMHHPYARKGMAELWAIQSSKAMAQMLGMAPEILSVTTSDVDAFILLQDTTGGSYSYQCYELAEGKMQALRVQTDFVTDEQKANLTQSVLAWLQTFRFDRPNTAIPKKTKLEEESVLNDLKRGITTSFESAVENAQKEYMAAVKGRVGTLQYLAEYGMLDDHAPDTVREILTQSMGVKSFYYAKADELVEKLNASQPAACLMEKVYAKLRELESCVTELSVDEENITVDVPAQVKSIQKKWSIDASKIAQIAKAEKEAKQKAEADRIRKEKEAAAEAERKRREEERKRREIAQREAEEKRKKEEEENRRIEKQRKEEEARLAAERRRREEEARIAAEKEAAERKAAEEAAAREREEQKRRKKEKFRKKLKRTLITLLVTAIVLIAAAVLTVTVILPEMDRASEYKMAQTYLETGRYDEAEAQFRALGAYKDASDLVYTAQYRKAEYLLETKQYPEAIAVWKTLESYLDSADRAVQAEEQWRGPDYQSALSRMEQGEYLAAAELFATLGSYQDSAQKAAECNALHLEQTYLLAQEAAQSGDYPAAMELYKQLGNYQDSGELYITCAYEYGKSLLAAKEYVAAVEYLDIASGHQNADELKTEANYRYGIQLLNEGKYSQAITQLGQCKEYLDSTSKIKDAKYAYAKANPDRNNQTTRTYLKELILDNYYGAQRLYDELYAWKAEIIAFNNSPYNHTPQNTISKYQTMCCHFEVTGGEPGDTVNLVAYVTAPNGQTGSIYFNSCSDGSIWTTYFTYDMPYYGATGTMSVRIVDADTGKQLDSGSVSVTN